MPGARLCPECLRSPPAISLTLAPFVYDDALALLIRQWKYHRDIGVAGVLAALWLDGSRGARDTAPGVDAVTFVPLHWRRFLFRGFNQSADLAAVLAGRLQLPLRRHLLRRIRATAPQAQASRRQRLRTLGGSIVATRALGGERIALVDDVCTTGATAEAAAQALLNAGAGEVQLWCLARTPAPGSADPEHVQPAL